MKAEITLKEADGKMTMTEVIRYYFPDISKEDANYILWEETCYPFSMSIALSQLYELYKQRTLTPPL